MYKILSPTAFTIRFGKQIPKTRIVTSCNFARHAFFFSERSRRRRPSSFGLRKKSLSV